MAKSIVNSSIQNESKSSQISQQKRLECSICNYQIEKNSESRLVTFPCNVEAFKDETFKVWRCPNCKTIHCLDVVELSSYYAKYPIGQGVLTFPLSLCYQNLLKRLTKHGLSKTHSILDYGCGENGLFLEYLKQKGYTNCYGYDPYGNPQKFGNTQNLQHKPFDYILLQDVIEHVEDPNILLSDLNNLLAPGGYILIGTPNSNKIDLNQQNIPDYYNSVHVPYHLHIYTREVLKSLGHYQGWNAVDFFEQPYHDTRWFALNARTWNYYQRISGGTINVIYEPFKIWKILISYKLLFYAIFGYWLSRKTDMTIIFKNQ